ncbi:MAG: ACT domain-containing protein, partial [Oscillospiraceae bacterium]
GVAFKLFSLLGAKGINVDVILQSVARDNTRDISFTAPIADIDGVTEVLKEHERLLGANGYSIDEDVAKVSIVGAGMMSHAGVASRMFRALSDAGINIKMISTSEIKISVIVARKDADRAVEAVHDEFINE